MEAQAGISQGQIRSTAMRGIYKATGGKMNPVTKMKMYYALVSCLIFALLGATSYFIDSLAPQVFFNVSALGFFLLGFLHFYLYDHWQLYNPESKFSSTFLFSILILVLGFITYTLAFYFLSKKSSYVFLMPITLIAFLIPLWIHRSFDLALNVPAVDYKKWYFPEKPIVLDFDNIDTSNISIITYVFSKKHGDTEISNFQTKAPYELKLGDLFYGFLQEWNHRNPQSTIEYMDEEKLPFGWLFYIKEAWYLPKRYLDPDLTIKDNKLKVNQIIITKRIKQDIAS